MSFVSLLEDLIDVQNDLDHMAQKNTSVTAERLRDRRTGRMTADFAGEDLRFDDADEANRYFRSQLHLVKRFIDFYKQERQLLNEKKAAYPLHFQVIDRLDKILAPVTAIESWDLEAQWKMVRGIEGRIDDLILQQQLNHALSPQLIEHLQHSAVEILRKARQLQKQLNRTIPVPRDPRVSEGVLDELESCATLLEVAIPQFQQDVSTLEGISGKLGPIREKWTTFLDLAATLPLKLQRRFTIKELGRLNLHPEQEEFVSLDHSGCFQLGGVSGSGKSIILIYRALRLAEEARDRTIRVLTINRALAVQLRGTLEVVSGGKLHPNVQVSSIYDLFQQAISVCHPISKYRLYDDRSGERVNQSWADFFHHRGKTSRSNVFAEQNVADLLKTLKKRMGSLEAAGEYLLDEVQCVQSAYIRRDRHAYLAEARMGRAFPFLESQKRAVLRVVNAWEEWLSIADLCDIHTTSLEASELLLGDESREAIRRECIADSILVDESQDLSTVEVMALRQLLREPDGENALFLTGDVCQKVYSKHQAIERAGFKVASSKQILRKNFRNTKEILSAAFRTIALVPPPAEVAGKLITRPELSPYSGSKPLVVDCTSVVHHDYIARLICKIAQERVAVVTENPQLLKSLLELLEKDPTVRCVHVQSNADIDRWRDIPESPTEIAVFLSTFDAVKGFEFDTVIVADASDRRDSPEDDAFDGLPPVGTPEGEYWRTATKFYVACTRARNHLIVTYSGRPSCLMAESSDDFDQMRADDQTLLNTVVGRSSDRRGDD